MEKAFNDHFDFTEKNESNMIWLKNATKNEPELSRELHSSWARMKASMVAEEKYLRVGKQQKKTTIKENAVETKKQKDAADEFHRLFIRNLRGWWYSSSHDIYPMTPGHQTMDSKTQDDLPPLLYLILPNLPMVCWREHEFAYYIEEIKNTMNEQHKKNVE